MQRILGVLRGAGPAEMAPLPGTEQLPDLISIARSAGLSVELAVSGEPGNLAPTAQLNVYRIIQESLTNVLKHGRNVRRVNVTLDHRKDHVRIQVTDDGEPGTPANAGTTGHGLVGMRERTALYQGEFHAGPTRGGGWEVTADLAVTDPEGAV
ncbi:sensor histidine kinase [Streptacidiphilus sp. PAMC 29251]